MTGDAEASKAVKANEKSQRDQELKSDPKKDNSSLPEPATRPKPENRMARRIAAAIARGAAKKAAETAAQGTTGGGGGERRIS